MIIGFPLNPSLVRSSPCGSLRFVLPGMNIVHPPYATNRYWYDLIDPSLIELPHWAPLADLHPCDLQSSMLKVPKPNHPIPPPSATCLDTTSPLIHPQPRSLPPCTCTAMPRSMHSLTTSPSHVRCDAQPPPSHVLFGLLCVGALTRPSMARPRPPCVTRPPGLDRPAPPAPSMLGPVFTPVARD